MPYKEKPVEKQYFSIGEVASRFGLTAGALRFYEQEFRQLRPRRTKAGTRRYSTNDVTVVERIRALLKDRGFTVKGARAELAALKVAKNNL